MPETKTCKNCTQKFTINEEDKNFYKKISVSIPAYCPDCRSQKRMAFRNEKTLYKRKCDLCRKLIISIYSSDKKFPVYCQDCFWSDKWNAQDYSLNYDPKKTFFKQFNELLEKTPRLGIINKQSENSDYCNYSFANKNCYLTFGNHYEEDCMYGRYSIKNKDCLDCLDLYQCELCYESLYSKSCYHSIYLDHCEDCLDCLFSVDLKDCKNCFFSSNLRHKQYYIFNKQYSKEDYFKKVESYKLDTFEGLERAKKYFLNEFRKQFPFRSSYQINCENCQGNNLTNCKNLRFCFDCSGCEDVTYATQSDQCYSCMDMTCMGYDKSELCYETIGCTGTFNCISCDSCWHDSNLRYCTLCFSSKDLFGCTSLQQKQYCILNKQYSKEEYENLTTEIIDKMQTANNWGEFFPMEISPFAYNETIANEHFTLSEEKILKLGLKWKEQEEKGVFKIQKKEQEFYRKMNLPDPKLHPDIRLENRLKIKTPSRLWERKCAKCGLKIQTSYSPDRPETIYCEPCYLAAVY